MDLQSYISYTTHLMRCSFNDEQPKPLPDGMSVEKLFRFCQTHQIENTVYYAIKKLELSQKELALFESAHFAGVVIDANQEDALKKVSKLFEENEIEYLVLKGGVIKALYPTKDMRQAADIDIYIGEKNALKAKTLMLDCGFKTDENLFGVDVDDSYTYGAYVNVELHRKMLPDVYKWKKECSQILKRLTKKSDSNYALRMSKEDFYVYMIIHIAKHMHLSGCGIRSVFDIWVYLEKYKDSLDEQAIYQSLQNCQLDAFEKNMRRLAYLWFGDEGTKDELLEELGYHIAVGGWLGRPEYRNAKYIAENYADSKKHGLSKAKYIFSMIFLDYDRMSKKYSILNKYKFLLPVFWVVRIIEGITRKKSKIQNLDSKTDSLQREIALGKKMLDFDKRIGL